MDSSDNHIHRSRINELGTPALVPCLWRDLKKKGKTHRGHVSKLIRMHLAKQDLSEHTTHDLAAPRLGQIRHDVYLFGSRKRPDAFSDLQDELLLQTFELPAAVVLDGHERVDGLTGHVVGDGDGRGFGHGGMLEQRGLDLGRREAMAADVDDVIDAPADPVVSVVIAGGQVAGELVEVLSARCREFLLEKKGEKREEDQKKKDLHRRHHKPSSRCP